MIVDKYTFASIAIISLVVLQLGAWSLGFDGQVTTFCFGGITAILGFITGASITFKGSSPIHEQVSPKKDKK